MPLTLDQLWHAFFTDVAMYYRACVDFSDGEPLLRPDECVHQMAVRYWRTNKPLIGPDGFSYDLARRRARRREQRRRQCQRKRDLLCGLRSLPSPDCVSHACGASFAVTSLTRPIASSYSLATASPLYLLAEIRALRLPAFTSSCLAASTSGCDLPFFACLVLASVE